MVCSNHSMYLYLVNIHFINIHFIGRGGVWQIITPELGFTGTKCKRKHIQMGLWRFWGYFFLHFLTFCKCLLKITHNSFCFSECACDCLTDPVVSCCLRVKPEVIPSRLSIDAAVWATETHTNTCTSTHACRIQMHAHTILPPALSPQFDSKNKDDDQKPQLLDWGF